MRVLATRSFSEKVARSSHQIISGIREALAEIDSAELSNLLSRLEPLLGGGVEVFVMKYADFQILLSFGSDKEGEYALLVDLVVQDEGAFRPLPSRDPQRNMMVDPKRNMMIDPGRNMMIDPSRNMMIDPNRNMMIDPRRNMMIDPRRNMMIDPNRNVMIDPRRNSLIDPKRNVLLDPGRNSVWDGPYIYDLSGGVVGFIVRANDKVALRFDNELNFVGPIIPAGTNYNLFDSRGEWTGFLVSNNAKGFNYFDTAGRWKGYVVGSILGAAAGVD